MKKLLLGSAAIAVLGTSVAAGGIERTQQSTQILYKKGNYVEYSFGQVTPDVTGKDKSQFGGSDIDNVAQQYNIPSFGAKFQLNDQFSVALISDSPYGANTEYGGGKTTTAFGGTSAVADVDALTFIGKYQFNDNVSVFGGLRRQTASGDISLNGLAYTADNVNGIPANLVVASLTGGAITTATGVGFNYDVELDSGAANGYVLGAAYEIPDIAFRVALTYNSEITHKLKTQETYNRLALIGSNALTLQTLTENSTTEVKTPKSWNLDFQSGVAKDTLVFGSVRWVEHSVFRLDPKLFVDQRDTGLIDFDNTITYRLGVGRRFNENFAGQISFAKETAASDLASPLGPTAGFSSVAVGGAYTFDNGLELSGGLNYTWLGDAKAHTAKVVKATFEDNTAMAAGIKLSYSF